MDPAAPRDHRRTDRRADRGGRHDAQWNDPAAATPRRRPPFSLRLRVGGGRGRAEARLPVVDAGRSPDRHQREARGDIARAGAGVVRHPPHVRPRARRGDRLPVRCVPVSCAGVGCPCAAIPVMDRRTGLRTGVRVPAPDAAVPAVAETAARSDRPALGAQVSGTPGLSRHLRAQFPDLHLVHMHRDPRDTIPSGASLNATLHAMHADRVDRHRVGAEWLERMGWTNDRAMATRAAVGRRRRAVHRHRVRRRGRRSDRPGGPRVRLDRCAADRRRGIGDAPLADRASTRACSTAVRGRRFRAQRRADRRAVRGLQLSIPRRRNPVKEDVDDRVHRRSRSRRRRNTNRNWLRSSSPSTRRCKAAYRSVAENWLARAKASDAMRAAFRRRLRRGDVLGGGVVVQPGQAAAEGQLHHPAGSSGGGSADPRITLGHRQSRQRVPGDPDLGRRAL